MPVEVIITTDDAQLAGIVHDYWEMDAENRFTRPASEVSAQYRALGYRGNFNDDLRRSALVVVNNLFCRSCSREVEVESRRELNKIARKVSAAGAASLDVDCPRCEQAPQEHDEAAEEAAKLERLRACAEEYAGQAENPDWWVDYSAVPFDGCITVGLRRMDRPCPSQ